MATQVPHQVLAAGEGGDGTRIQHGIRSEIQNVDSFGSTDVVEIHKIERDPVRAGVGEFEVEG